MAYGTFDPYERLLSPDEFQESSLQHEFYNYGQYLNKFTQQQKIRRQSQGAGNIGTNGMQFSRDEGTQYVGQGGGSFGAAGQPITYGGYSGSGQQGTTGQAGKGGSAIPSYRTHTGLGGEVSYETRGGRRKIGGEFIPTSMEEERQQAELGYAVPKMQATAEADYFTELNRVAQQKTAERNPKAIMEAAKVAQGNAKVAVSQGKLKLEQEKFLNHKAEFLQSQTFKQANLNLTSKLRIEAIKVYEGLRKDRDILNDQQATKMKNAMGLLVNTPLYDEKQQDAINKVQEMLALKAAQDLSDDQRKRVEEMQNQIVIAERMAAMKNIDENKFEETKDLMNRGILDKFGERVATIMGAGSTKSYNSLSDLTADYKAGNIDRATAEKIIKAKGW